jgi:hypothetical protein
VIKSLLFQKNAVILQAQKENLITNKQTTKKKGLRL